MTADAATNPVPATKKAAAKSEATEQESVVRTDKFGRQFIPLSAIEKAPENIGRPSAGAKREEPEKFQAFANVIKRVGIIYPLIVKPTENPKKFFLLDGERRLRAAKANGMAEVPVIFYNGKATDKEIALMSNAARRDLNPVQLASALASLIADGMPKGKAGESLGLDNASVTQYLKLDAADEATKEKVVSGFYSFGALLTMEKVKAALDPSLVAEFQKRMAEKEANLKARQAQKENGKKLPKTPKPEKGKKGKEAKGVSASHVKETAAEMAKDNPKAAAQLKKAGIATSAVFDFTTTVETYFADSGDPAREAFADLYDQLVKGKIDGEAFAIAFDALIAPAEE